MNTRKPAIPKPNFGGDDEAFCEQVQHLVEQLVVVLRSRRDSRGKLDKISRTCIMALRGILRSTTGRALREDLCDE